MSNRKPRVAVVEDNDCLRELYVAVLEAEDYEVAEFAHGISEGGWGDYDLVFIDLREGVTIVRRVGEKLRCIGITGTDGPLTNTALRLAIELALAL